MLTNEFDNLDIGTPESKHHTNKPSTALNISDFMDQVHKNPIALVDASTDDSNITFETLQENMRLWHELYHSYPAVDLEQMVQEIDALDLSIPGSDEVLYDECIQAYNRLVNARTIITRYIAKVSLFCHCYDIASKEFFQQAKGLMPGKVADKEARASSVVYKYKLAGALMNNTKDYLEQMLWNTKTQIEALNQIVFAIMSERKYSNLGK